PSSGEPRRGVRPNAEGFLPRGAFDQAKGILDRPSARRLNAARKIPRSATGAPSANLKDFATSFALGGRSALAGPDVWLLPPIGRRWSGRKDRLFRSALDHSWTKSVDRPLAPALPCPPSEATPPCASEKWLSSVDF